MSNEACLLALLVHHACSLCVQTHESEFFVLVLPFSFDFMAKGNSFFCRQWDLLVRMLFNLVAGTTNTANVNA